MKFQELEDYILALPNTELSFPFGEDVNVYKVTVGDEQKMFALIPHSKSPVRVSLKCDPQLAIALREKYESILEGYHLNKRHWNTMLMTGQLSEQEVTDLILHSYNLVSGNNVAPPAIQD